MRSALPLQVVLVGGLAQEAVDAAAHVVLGARRGRGLVYRVVLDGASPLLIRTTAEGGVCVSEVPLATSHGCIACAVRDDVLAHLADWSGDASEVTIVLPAGADLACLVDPLDLSFLALHEADPGGAPDEEPTYAQITSVVAAVDGGDLVAMCTTSDEVGESGLAVGAFGTRPLAELALGTLRLADIVVVDGLGPVVDAESAQALELVAHVAPQAQVVRSALTGRLVEAVSVATHDPTRTDLRHEPLGTPPAGRPPAHGVTTQVWTSRRPLHPRRLMDAFEQLAELAVSLEGPVWVANRQHEVLRLVITGGAASVNVADAWLGEAPADVWDQVSPWRRVQAEMSWDPYYGDRECRLVVLTVDDDDAAERVADVLRSVVLTDNELSDGPGAWAGFDDPFAPWLGDPWTQHPELLAQPSCDGVHDHERAPLTGTGSDDVAAAAAHDEPGSLPG